MRPFLMMLATACVALLGTATSVVAAPAAAVPLSLTGIKTLKEFDAYSVPSNGLVNAGRNLKFVIDLRQPKRTILRFVNGNYAEKGVVPRAAQLHYYFAQRAMGSTDSIKAFNDSTYFTDKKRWVVGTLQSLPGKTPQETQKAPRFGVEFYPQDLIHGRAVLDAIEIVRRGIAIPNARFAFIEAGAHQKVDDARAAFKKADVEILTVADVMKGITYLAMHSGEAVGYLRIFPKDPEALAPTDIAVFDELPLDLSVVAGTITRSFQDATSHVNLKSKERDTPNMVLRTAGPNDPRLAPFEGKPVRLTVASDGFVLEPATEAEIEAASAKRLTRPWVPIKWTRGKTVTSFDDLCPASPKQCLDAVPTYGSKAAMLGFLANKAVLGRQSQRGSFSNRFGYDLSPLGLAVPLAFYEDFVNGSAELKTRTKELIAREKAGKLTPQTRDAETGALRAAFLTAPLASGRAEALAAAAFGAMPNTRKIKVRSSANAEDLPNFDGAGLYASYAARLDKKDREDGACAVVVDAEEAEVKAKVDPKTLACAVKATYASLWNKRAVEERTYARFDHASAAMGLAIVPAYDQEAEVVANAVVITRILNATAMHGYTLTTQIGDNLVTNPDPGTYAEVVAATIGYNGGITLTRTRFAKPAANGAERTTAILSDALLERIVSVTRHIEETYCATKAGYFPLPCNRVSWDKHKTTALDLELKILKDGRIVFKQMREFTAPED